MKTAYLRLAPFLTLFWLPTHCFSEPLTLAHLQNLLKEKNPGLFGAEARQQEAEAGLITARAYPNPDLELSAGSSTGRGEGATNGGNQQVYLAQAIELPFVREARSQVAELGIDAAQQARQAVWLLVNAKLSLSYYEILRRQAELHIAEDNQRLLQQVRDKVVLKVEVGEAAQYEAVKAEAELLNAIKLSNMARVQVSDAESAIRALFIDGLPQPLQLAEQGLPTLPDLIALPQLRDNVLSHYPALQQAQLEIEQAQKQLELEQDRRYPQPTLKAGIQRDPGLEQWQIGISIPLPVWNQRQGPIAEAHAALQRIQAEAQQLRLSTIRELENAYNRYQMAHQQVQTFESGLLKQAERALKVAEAAYRLGERGILDYLDAQRTYRSVRNDYINAQFDRQQALIDIQRLNAIDSQG